MKIKRLKQITLIGIVSVLLWFLGVIAFYHLFIKNRSNIDLAAYGFVTDYLHNTYGGSYTLNRGRFVQYDYGITGGMFQYYFYVSDETGKDYVAHYCRFPDLSPETVRTLTFEEAVR